jgi:hypothetical protein
MLDLRKYAEPTLKRDNDNHASRSMIEILTKNIKSPIKLRTFLHHHTINFPQKMKRHTPLPIHPISPFLLPNTT